MYRPFESGLPGPTGRVYRHEIPGGQLSNLRQQAIALGLGDQFEKVEDWYAAANRILGRPPKVTPSSKVVGDLALMLAAADADPDDFEQNPDKYDIPDSVIGFMAGELGDLPGGWPEPFRTKVLAGRNVKIGVEEISDEDRAALAGNSAERQRRAEPAALPGADAPVRAGARAVRRPVAVDTIDYLYGLQPGVEHAVEISKGVDLLLTLEAIGEADDKGMRTVMTTINGQLRPVAVRDRSITVEQQGRREGRPEQAGSGRRSVLGRRDAQDLARATRSRPASRSRRSRR